MARILVVDDESLIRALVAEVGSSLGHEVLEAASIKEGFVLARTGVDIVLLARPGSRTATGWPTWTPSRSSRDALTSSSSPGTATPTPPKRPCARARGNIWSSPCARAI